MTRAALLLLACAAPGVWAQDLRLEQHEPRAYGWQVGDVFERTLVLQGPAGARLDAQSLPRLQQAGQPIELRSVAVQRDDDGRRHTLRLRYQVFLAPAQPRLLEIAPFTLRVQLGPRELTQRVEAWPVLVAPLLGDDAPQRRGLGDAQPDLPPPAPEPGGRAVRLAAWATLALLAFGWLGWSFVGWPWAQARQRPFQQAWRTLRRLGDAATTDEERAACQVLHAALNRAAGEVLYADALPAFLARAPSYAGQQAALARFFQRSRALFFESAAPAAPTGWLRELARALRRAEQGLG